MPHHYNLHSYLFLLVFSFIDPLGAAFLLLTPCFSSFSHQVRDQREEKTDYFGLTEAEAPNFDREWGTKASGLYRPSFNNAQPARNRGLYRFCFDLNYLKIYITVPTLVSRNHLLNDILFQKIVQQLSTI